VFGLLAVIFLYKNKPMLSVICYFISYFFDCCDGYYARKYNMCTKFGDFYDHVKDWVINFLFIGLLIYRNKNKLTLIQWSFAGILCVFLFIMMTIYFS
jgi:phosphatidylglycerophosphate synthase